MSDPSSILPATRQIEKVCMADPLFNNYFNDISCRAIATFKEHGVDEQELRRLASFLDIVYPWDPRYNTLRQNFNRRFVVYPLAILLATSDDDITFILKWTGEHMIPISLRSGAHCYEPFSLTEGIVIDQSLRTSIKVNTENCTVSIRCGVRLGPLAFELSKYGLALPSGTCANNGSCGLILGGGIGFLERNFGLTLDNLLAADIILADGDKIRASQESHQELFFALRGAGGGNYGVVTKLVLRAFPIDEVVLFELRWPFTSLKEVAFVWQHWGPFVPDNLNSEMDLFASTLVKHIEPVHGAPRKEDCHYPVGETTDLFSSLPVEVTGQWIGSVCDLVALLQPLLNLPGVQARIWRSTYLDGARYFTAKKAPPPFFKNKSNFITGFLTPEALDVIQRWLNVEDPEGFFRLEFNAFGGVVNRVPVNATAFPHREGTLFWLQYISRWSNEYQAQRRIAWVRGLYAELQPLITTSGAYVNCPDLDLGVRALPDYFGPNLPRLTVIKAIYDPENRFRFPQSIPPAL